MPFCHQRCVPGRIASRRRLRVRRKAWNLRRQCDGTEAHLELASGLLVGIANRVTSVPPTELFPRKRRSVLRKLTPRSVVLRVNRARFLARRDAAPTTRVVDAIDNRGSKHDGTDDLDDREQAEALNGIEHEHAPIGWSVNASRLLTVPVNGRNEPSQQSHSDATTDRSCARF